MKDKAILKLENSISEAERFLEKARKAKAQFKNGSEDTFRSHSFAAAKRASMDLTRSLSILRKGLYL